MKATTKIVKKLNIVKKPVVKELPETPVTKEPTPVTKNRNEVKSQGSLTNRNLNFVNRKIFTSKILFHQRII